MAIIDVASQPTAGRTAPWPAALLVSLRRVVARVRAGRGPRRDPAFAAGIAALAGTRAIASPPDARRALPAGTADAIARRAVEVGGEPSMIVDKPGLGSLYDALFRAFPDLRAVVHWQTAERDLVTTFKTYHGTHSRTFLGVAPTGRKVQVDVVDTVRLRDGDVIDHWGVANMFALMQQIGAVARMVDWCRPEGREYFSFPATPRSATLGADHPGSD